MGKALPTRRRAQPADPEVPARSETPQRPDWMGDDEVVRILDDGEERPATDDEIAAVSTPTQPDHVLVELRSDGTRRVLVYEEAAYTHGEMFGASNESNGPHFKVVDN